MKISRLDELKSEGVSHDPAILKRVLVRNGEVPHLAQFARATFEPGQVAAAHRHTDMWELFVCEAGSGRMLVEDVEVTLEVGTCIVVEAGERHELRNPGSVPLVVTVLGVVVG